MSISETRSWTAERIVERFAAGWREPGPHAWDDLLADDVVLRQPLMPDGTGRRHWQDELGRLQAFLPDLRGEVVDWAARGDTVFIELACRATAAGRPLEFRAVDRLTVGPDGRVTARTSRFDPLPLLGTLVARPGAWPRWWRSGTAPFIGRRAPVDGPARVARALGTIRTGVGLTALASPRTAHRALDPGSGVSAGGFLARGFGVRELAVAAATLSRDPARMRFGLALGVLVDGVDAVSVLLGGRRIPRSGRMLAGLPAAAFAIAGAGALARTRPRRTAA